MENIKTISFIIPVYNERNTIIKLLERVDSVDLGLEKEIILIDDCSSDGTREIIEELSEKYLKIYHNVNMGKGAAIRTGVQTASGELLIIQDADLEYDPEEIKILLSPVLRGDADIVYGSRFISSGARRALFFWHMVGNKFLTLMTNMVTNINLTDMETCYKLFKTDIIKNVSIEENRFGFEAEITIKACQMNCRIYEVGISYYGRTYHQGKKITWKDGVSALKCIIKYGIIRKFINQEPFLEKFLRKLRIRKILPYIQSKIICDIGCGKDMAFLNAVSPLVYKCIGIDKKVSAVSYSNIEVKNFEFQNKIPLEDESVDTVTMMAVLEHIENDIDMIAEIKRILKPEGVLLITVPSEKARPVLEFLSYRLHIVSKEEIMDHKRYYTVESLKDIIISSGFICMKIHYFQFGYNIFCCAQKLLKQGNRPADKSAE
ncbi:Glycosyltransferase [Desulfonema limicola]|uniref:Glycosyltransferase n=1 Tax=Desulfonema limicola TaxID=45656 RepID=A0A975BAA3_9BACT|nr:glycosyltransferase [Desulfonema limicola]QTA81919.1 Glycosyltransferase [Desulfonema limicola]